MSEKNEGVQPTDKNSPITKIEDIPAEPPVETPAEPPVETPADPPADSPQDDWKPNFQLDVMDQKYEIPEWVRGIVTKENEEEVRDTFKKAFGLDHLKQKNQDLLASKEQIINEFNEFKSGISDIVEHKKNGDLGAFFDKLYLYEY